MSVVSEVRGSWVPAPVRLWRSGPWAIELREDELADVSFEGRTVLRSIRAVVRDRDWNTAALDVGEPVATDTTLDLPVRSRGWGSDLAGSVRIKAAGHRLVVRLDLVSGAEFWTNRTGLVVLHPPTLTGEDLRVRHSDGSSEVLAYPDEISPHQPVRDIVELAWRDDGVDVDVRFGGDVFEMEDQRNWTDASFKTYSRPLELPFPYRLAAGEGVAQCVEVRARVELPPAGRPDPDRVELVRGGAFPSIGLAASTAPDPAPPRAETGPIGAFTLVELDLGTVNWRAALDRAAASGLPLDVRMILSDAHPAAVGDAARALRDLPVARVAAFAASGPAAHVSDAGTTAVLRTALAAAGVAVPVVGGTRAHFTELNREHRRLPDDLDGIVFGLTPLFHAQGTEQLVESLPVQRLVVEQAVRIGAGIPVHVGPVTLRPRFNNVSTSTPPATAGSVLEAGYGPHLLDGFADDARQSAAELAAWTIASAAALAVPGVASLTYFEQWGPRGIRTADGDDLPVAAAVQALAGLSGDELLSGATGDGLVWAVGAVSSAGETVLVANLDSHARVVTVTTPCGSRDVDVSAGGWTLLG